MTPAEQRLMERVIADTVAAAVRPLQEEIASLKGTDRHHSLQIRAVTQHEIPQMATAFRAERTDDITAIAAAYERLVHVVNDVADTQALIIDNQKRADEARARTMVSVEGSTAVLPASVVAVNQNKALAVDAEATVAKVRSISTWQKVGLSIVGAIPVIIEIIKLVSPAVPK